MAFYVKQLVADDERLLRRWLCNYDTDFAAHRQLKDYFLAPTKDFGTLAAYQDNVLCAFSRYPEENHFCIR